MKRALFAAAAFLALAAPAAASSSETLTLDARDVTRRVLHARLELGATPGDTTLVFPRWVAGEHAPNGRIADLVQVQATSGGRSVAWRRDPVDLYAFHFAVPRGANALTLRYDVLLPAGYSTAQLALLNWNDAVLYRQAPGIRETMVGGTLLLPAGWNAATALPGASKRGDRIAFAPVSLERLIDSPVLTGANLATVAAGPDAVLDVASDGLGAPAVGDDVRAAFAKTVAEAEAIFGGHHWTDPYHFLITASDAIGFEGLEHHNSSWNGVDTDSLESLLKAKRFAGDLLTHEFTHSWDGKYRRPAGLAKLDNQVTEEDDLLWVYEGMTEYYGIVLAARAGFWTPDEARAHFANDYAALDTSPGRATRPLMDAQLNEIIDPRGRRRSFLADRFGAGAQYSEGTMIWLDADTLIRERSAGARSLDTFAAQFFGGTTPPEVRPYTRADLIAALNAVEPYDWAAFFHDRVDVATPHPAGAWIARGGYTLAYVAKPKATLPRGRAGDNIVNWRYGPGFALSAAGVIGDVVAGTPAARSGLAPNQHIIAVDGRRYSASEFAAAIERAAKTKRPIALLIDDRGTFVRRSLPWYDGIRLPELQRADGPDRLGDILAPRTGPNPTPAPSPLPSPLR